MPKTESSQPHWNTATTAPNAAPAERMFITAAISGTTMLRKTAASSRNESSTTTPMNSGSLFDSTEAKSEKIAVWPPISTRAPLPAVARGTTVLRSLVSRSLVDLACGEPVGKMSAVRTGLLPDAPVSVTAGDTFLTPLVALVAVRTLANACFCAGESTWATTCSGPLYPGPKPLASRS